MPTQLRPRRRVLHPDASMARFLEQGFALYCGDPGAPRHLGVGAAIHRENMKSLFTMCAASAQQQAAMQEEVLAAWNDITEDAPVSVLVASKRVAHAGDRGTVGVPIGPFRALLKHALLQGQVRLPWGAREADAPTQEARRRREVQRQKQEEEEEEAARAAASRRRAAEGRVEAEEAAGGGDAAADTLAALRTAGEGVLADALDLPPASNEASFLAPLELRYVPVLRAFLARERRRRSARARLHRTIAERHRTIANAVFQHWFGRVARRLKARRALANLARKWRDSGIRRAVEALSQRAIRCCAAERIQAVARGRRGRRLHGQAVRRHRAARRLQRWWRGYRFGMEGLAIRARRRRAAIDVQVRAAAPCGLHPRPSSPPTNRPPLPGPPPAAVPSARAAHVARVQRPSARSEAQAGDVPRGVRAAACRAADVYGAQLARCRRRHTGRRPFHPPPQAAQAQD